MTRILLLVLGALLALFIIIEGGEATKCRSPLGVSSGGIKDNQMTASSSFSPASVGPENGRLGTERGGGAWCPAQLISQHSDQEWLQVDLLKETIITGVITQGRYAGGQGEEFAELISVEVWQEEDQTWLRVVEEAPANRDTYSKVELMLDRRVVTDKVRVIPVSEHHRMVCLRIELLGCSPDDLVESTTVAANLPDKVDDINENLIEQVVKKDTPRKLVTNKSKKLESLTKSRVSKPLNDIDEKYMITNSQNDNIVVQDILTKIDDISINGTDSSNDKDSEIVSITSPESQYMLVSVIVLVTIIVILIITIIFILYKNYQFTHSKNLNNSDSDTLESSYPLYTARTIDSNSHQVYSNSVQSTPYKHHPSNQSTPYKQQSTPFMYQESVHSTPFKQQHSTSFNTYYQGPPHNSSPPSQSHYSNYYATTDLIQWHNRKYLSGHRGSHGGCSGGPVDL